MTQDPIRGHLDGEEKEIIFFLTESKRDDHIRKHLLVGDRPVALNEDYPEVLRVREEVRQSISGYLQGLGFDPRKVRCLQVEGVKDGERPERCLDESGECPHRREFCHDQLSRLETYYRRAIERMAKEESGPRFRCHLHGLHAQGGNITIAGRNGLKVAVWSHDDKMYNLKSAYFMGFRHYLENPDWWQRNADWLTEQALHDEMEMKETTGCGAFHCSCGGGK